MTLDELDRLAAEELMGLPDLSAKDFIPVPNDGKLYFTKLHAPECCPEPWQPTRNIAQAWECVEALGELSEIKIGSNCNFFEGGKYFVDLYQQHIVCADSIPHAITLACLKAKGVEV